MSLRSWCVALLVLLTLLGCPAYAQSTPEICISNYYRENPPGTESLGIVPSDVQILVLSVSRSIGLPTADGIAIIPCGDGTVEKVVAWYSPGKESAPLGEYIAYDPTWVREVIGDDGVQAAALFGHELGHILMRHFTSNRGKSRVQKETEADGFAGCAVAKRGGDWETLANLFSRLREDESNGFYPSRSESLRAAKEGFDRCTDIVPPPPPPPPSELQILYYAKSADNGAVLDVLSAQDLNYETLQGTNPLATNALTCTPDVDFDLVKVLALNLYDAGIQLKGVFRPRLSQMPERRITIEAFDDLESRASLSREEIEGLTSCENRPIAVAKASRIQFTHACEAPYPMHVAVRFFDDAEDKWRIVGFDLDPEEDQFIHVRDGSEEAKTSVPFLYYYASINEIEYFWKGNPGEYEYQATSDESDIQPFRRTSKKSIRLTCHG